MARAVVARAPGRVNLIGEHTDYNDGFVLPLALPFDTVIDARSNGERRVRLHSEGFPDAEFSLDDDPKQVEPWARYVAGMLRFLSDGGQEVHGFDARLTTTIPVGASLSSSAALEVASGFVACGLADVEPDPVWIARLGQRVENEVVGIQSGIMDQLISAAAVKGTATLIDCRSLETTPVGLPASARVVIMDTMTRRELADSAYDNRRESCERAAAALGLTALRDATVGDVETLPDGIDKRRAAHVVAENQRVLDAVEAFRSEDLGRAGDLMNASHTSLSIDYEVSSPALDQMAEIARSHDACFGARMTGGGFAGSAVALIDATRADEFVAHLRREWERANAVRPDVWVVAPAGGASLSVRDV